MSTRSGVAFVALAVALGAAGCEGSLFAPPATLPPRLELAVAATATDSAAFEGIDAIRVQVAGEMSVLLDSVLAFRSAGAETRVHVAVQLESSQVPVAIAVELRTAGQTVFRGTGSGTLTRGQTTVVPITLARVLYDAQPLASVARERVRPGTG